ncbi:MAG: arsenic efflux protein [Clostridiales bacterium]|nr:arsenic efflux protein [Clostridiales bacterium]
MQEVILDTVLDTVKLIPFLLVTYLLMEYMEHRAKGRMIELIRKNGVAGPVMGAVIGIFPQCGFSASAANFYAGHMINLGTLVAVFLSTSDEMLPILLSEQVPVGTIAEILLFKVMTAVVVGVAVNVLWKMLRREQTEVDIHSMCEKEHCHCENGIVRSAIHHTLHITGFILLFSFVLNTAILFIGEETLAGFLMNKPVIGPMLTAMIGLIPNCAASILITQMYLEGLMGVGAMMAGLLAGSGVGLAVLFKVNHRLKENLTILGLLYAIGAGVGILLELFV